MSHLTLLSVHNVIPEVGYRVILCILHIICYILYHIMCECVCVCVCVCVYDYAVRVRYSILYFRLEG